MSYTDMQMVMRHASIVTTAHYVHKLGVSQDKINAVFSSSPAPV